jgi:hypothetical protein
MNNKKYWSSCIYPLFLSTLGSCTYASFTDEELQAELDNLALRAIAKFKFPKVSLDYVYDEELEDETETEDTNTSTTEDDEVENDSSTASNRKKGYYFVEDVTAKEIRVIVS